MFLHLTVPLPVFFLFFLTFLFYFLTLCFSGHPLLMPLPSRSPSPEPIYNSEGKRLNTREYRTKKKFEEERHGLITKMTAINPSYKPPSDYK